MGRFHEEVFGIFFDDLDPFRILHNARYLLMFERAVGTMWMQLGLGSFEDGARPEQLHVVRRNEIDYLEPVRGVGRVRVRVEIESIGRTSLTFAFRMMPMDRDVDCARGRRTVVHVEQDTLKPTPWPDSLRASIAPWLADKADPKD